MNTCENCDNEGKGYDEQPCVDCVSYDRWMAPAVTIDDGARYRFLRNQLIEKNFPRRGIFIGLIPENMALTGADADEAIDSAIRAEAERIK